MKILLVSNFGYIAGGAEANVRLIRDALLARGHSVKVLTSDVHGKNMFSDYTFKAISKKRWTKILHHLFYIRSFIALRKAIKEFKPELIHFHTLAECSPSVLFASWGTPAVMTTHGVEEFLVKLYPWLMLSTDYKNELFNLRDLTVAGRCRYFYYKYCLRPIYKVALLNISSFIAPSKYFANLVSFDLPREKILQIYNGTDLPSSRSIHINHNALYIGRLEELKGVQYLIKSFSDVVATFPDAQLSIVGNGDAKQSFEQLVNELGLNENVIFYGWLESKVQILDEYEKASVVVIPSVWPENLPTVCMEAMAIGRPVIGTNVGGLPEMIENGKTGYVVKVKEESAISTAIKNIFSNPTLLEQMHVEATKSVKRFSTANFIDQLEKLYSKTIYANTHR